VKAVAQGCDQYNSVFCWRSGDHGLGAMAIMCSQEMFHNQ